MIRDSFLVTCYFVQGLYSFLIPALGNCSLLWRRVCPSIVCHQHWLQHLPPATMMVSSAPDPESKFQSCMSSNTKKYEVLEASAFWQYEDPAFTHMHSWVERQTARNYIDFKTMAALEIFGLLWGQLQARRKMHIVRTTTKLMVRKAFFCPNFSTCCFCNAFALLSFWGCPYAQGCQRRLASTQVGQIWNVSVERALRTSKW